jgi:hypothetical protein
MRLALQHVPDVTIREVKVIRKTATHDEIFVLSVEGAEAIDLARDLQDVQAVVPQP